MPSIMWASSALPILSGDRIGRRNKNSSVPSPPSPPVLAQLHSQTITDLLEPAIDGPPSPESIRAFSQQMRQSSVHDKHQSRHTSSGSSSLLSLVSSGRASWEHQLEGPPALSRRSSGRSTNSIMQAPAQWERADSVQQLFSKNIFNRKSRLRRDSSAQSSASSSVYSSDIPTSDPKSCLFSRRRTQRPGSLATDSGRPQISGPYNFQHVTHTDKERLSNLQRSSSAILRTELSTIRTSQVPSCGALKGIQAESLRFPDFGSSENLSTLDEDSTMTMDDVSPRTSLSRSSQTPSPPRRSQMRWNRSQEQISGGQSSPPIPPSRVSSRLSMRSDGIDGIVDRPQTSAGIPERLVESIEEHEEEEEEDDDDEDEGLQMRRSGFRESYVLPTEYRFSRILSVGTVAPEDVNWPLISPTNTSFDTSLADVPEEEEHAALTQARSRLSIISTHSSLRGSNSVPHLRHLSLRQGSAAPAPAPAPRARAPSNASETLGRCDFVSTQPAPGDVPEGGDAAEFLSRESWEDDIDYCYEHEVEADCDYRWERPSLDLSREDETATPVYYAVDGDDDDILPSSPMGSLHPGHHHWDVPALSPCVSINAASEAFTPVSAVAPAANFSLRQPLRVRTGSTATFKESQGFNLSPSLLIPGSDYHHQMHMMLDDDRQWYQQEDDSVVTYIPYQEPVLSMDRSALLIQSRTSASTVASTSTADSADLLQRRHDSTASSSAASSTALTDLTRSTSSVNVQGLLAGESAASIEERRNFSHVLPASPRKTKDDAAAATPKPSKLQKEPASPAPNMPAPSPPPMLRRRRAKTAGSEARPARVRPTTAPFIAFPAYNLALSRI
ncbi:hypothetical protein RB597_007952 [Gaeumannomyces tritici]